MKSYRKGILVGILIGVGSFLFMGSTNYETQKQNKFEFHMSNNTQNWGSNGIVINTETGETWIINDSKKTKHKTIKDN